MQKEYSHEALKKLVDRNGGCPVVAERTGIDYTQLYRYYTGEVKPRQPIIEKIQAVYPEFLNESETDQVLIVELEAARKEVAYLKEIIQLQKDKEKLNAEQVSMVEEARKMREVGKNLVEQMTIMSKTVFSVEGKVERILAQSD